MDWINHGTVNDQNLGSISSEIPWEPTSSFFKRFDQLNPPENGFLTYHGSACASLATTSQLYGSYIAMENAICLDYTRLGNPIIKVYKYIVNTQRELWQPPKTLYRKDHYLKPENLIIKELSSEYQEKIKEHFV